MTSLSISTIIILSFVMTTTSIVFMTTPENVFATTNSDSNFNSNDTVTPTVQIANNNTEVSENDTNSSDQIVDLSTTLPRENSGIHSKDLTINKASIRESGDSYYTSKSIAGSLMNNSNETIEDISIYAALFDENNNLYAINSGNVDFNTLKPNEDSSFKIDVYSGDPADLDHFMLFVSGAPPQASN